MPTQLLIEILYDSISRQKFHDDGDAETACSSLVMVDVWCVFSERLAVVHVPGHTVRSRTYGICTTASKFITKSYKYTSSLNAKTAFVLFDQVTGIIVQ